LTLALSLLGFASLVLRGVVGPIAILVLWFYF
jgi:hypothetical protein